MPLENIKNYQEQLVFERIEALAANYSSISPDQLEDIAYIALNTLRSRYVRRLTALHRYMTDDQRRTKIIQSSSDSMDPRSSNTYSKAARKIGRSWHRGRNRR